MRGALLVIRNTLGIVQGESMEDRRTYSRDWVIGRMLAWAIWLVPTSCLLALAVLVSANRFVVAGFSWPSAIAVVVAPWVIALSWLVVNAWLRNRHRLPHA